MLHFSVRIPWQDRGLSVGYLQAWQLNGGGGGLPQNKFSYTSHVVVIAGLHIRNLAFPLAAVPNHLTESN